MNNFKISFLFVIMAFTITGCCKHNENSHDISSPSNNISVDFFLDDDGSPNYAIAFLGQNIIDTSSMGFEFLDQPQMQSGFKVIETENSSVNEEWEMPWGEQRMVVNNYNELIVKLQEKNAPKRKLVIYFKAYDDGVGFRYEFPKQKGVDSLTIIDENTQFKLTGDHTCWWIPGDWDIYEHLYNTTKFTDIDAISKRNHYGLAQTYIPENAVNTPVTMRTDDGVHLSFHEANLTDYAGMTLKIDKENLSMTSELVGSERVNYKVKRALPFVTPWRTIQISENATGLIDSKLILNLNEPNILGDVSWFIPKKYMGIWWEMHIGTKSWDLKSGKHGATTENALKFIDFASKNNIKGLLIEGWNTGWEHWIGFEDREGVFDFVTPYPDYNIDEVVAYAKSKGVEIIMHHETSGAPRTYDKQMDTAFALMNKYGMTSVKTGYVGKIIPKGEYHHGQWMVNHYRKVIENAAKHNIAVNAHEPIKATGIRRTYPNAISREGLRGQEFNAWAMDGGNPPEHLSIIAFTRMLAGPIDFTPGVFDIKLPTKENNQVNTTIAHQLALYVVIYSPIQMACDLTENYEGNCAFDFIKDVGVDWEQTKVLNGEVGDFVTIAREERGTGNWFVGSITDENSRDITINFDFLPANISYKAMVYKDAPNTHWNDNPTSYELEELTITNDLVKTFHLAEGGGLAISLIAQK
ncbi:MAG: glycoside hydrolase family 97 protein [Bacteroidetes bacterium]|nr:glycoside hydrolase family 97 protein [Bacteroidota bacterium]